MRRFTPLLILVIGLLALAADFAPLKIFPTLTNPQAGAQNLETKLGLDLKGGVQIVYQAQPQNGRTPTSDDMNVIKNIVENRVNSTGVSEPVIETQGNNEIVVQLPGVSDPNAIRNLVGQAGNLQFYPLPVADYGSVNSPGAKSAAGLAGQAIPAGLTPLFGGDQVDGGSVVNGYDAQNSNGWFVRFTLRSPAKEQFATWSAANVNNFFAIALDGKVVEAPYIKQAITDGTAVISGSFTAQTSKQLATVLQYGALPFPIAEQSFANIPPTLGAQFLNQTLWAGFIGIGLVLLFMLIYYRLPGVIADLALLYYALVVLAFFRLMPVTLTLAGIAGFVLSVGMAVDANILIFERSKEELRLGKTLPAAIEAGFNRAWNSILDSNVSSLITATILYLFGTSIIRGFALVLIIGVLTSMFTAITVSRTLLRFVVQRESARRAWLFGVTEEEFRARSLTGRPVRGEARARV